MQKTALKSPNKKALINWYSDDSCRKTVQQRSRSWPLSTKTLLIMKLTVLFLALGLLNAQAGVSQTISFAGKNVSLSEVFKAIEKQTGYTVFANKNSLKNVKGVSVSAKDMPLTQFLDMVFKDQNIDYEIRNKTIFLKQGSSAPPPPHNTQTAEKEKPPYIQITGTVSGADSSVLEGATVAVKGTSISTVTNASGAFTINAEPDQTLVVSFVGFKVAEVPVRGRTRINIVLQRDVVEVEQVVVTALGIPRRTKALTYAVQEVKGEDLTKVKDANLVNGLLGKVSGVTINNAASGIGGSARVIMRGAKSLFGNNNALYVVDGIPLPFLPNTEPNDVFQGAGQSGDGISNINPEDIASVSVLTGAAATALYGSQAANGVVVITTRKGTAGKLSVSLANNTSFFSPFILPEFQNTYGSNPGDYYSWGAKLKTPSTYDPKEFFQTGRNITNAISVATGNEKNQTYISAAHVDAKGIITNNELSRYNFSLRNTSSFLDDRITLDLGAMYITTREQNMLSQGQYFNPLIPVYLFPRGDDIQRYQVFERYNAARNFDTQFWPYGDMGFQMQNPYWIINRDFFNNKKDRYILSAAAKYNIAPWINIAGRARIDNNTGVAEKKFWASTSGLFASPAGAYYKNNALTKQTYADVLVSINKTINRDYTLTANVGASIQDAQYSLSGYGGFLQSVPNLFHFSNVNSTLGAPTQDDYRDQVQSVFGTAQLDYRRMIFLDITGRNDWASALANSTANSIFYPSFGVSGILTDIFRYRSNILSFAKVRASYSEAGNAPQRFVTIPTFPIIGGFPVTTSYLPATGLEPERTKSFEVGLNLKLFRSKVNLDVTAYKSDTYNQLFNPTLAPSTGYSSFFVNAGQVTNKGIEASLSYNTKIARKVDWTSSLTFTLNRNKIVQLLSTYTDKVTGQTVSVDSLSVGGTGSYMMALVKRGSIGDIYVTTLETDEHGYIDVGLVSQTVTAATNTYIKVGSANPRYNIGFRNGFSYKNFNLDFLITARIGGVGVSVTQAILDRFGVSKASADARDQGGVIVNGEMIPAQPYYEVVGGGVAGVGSMYVYSATNVRLGEASLGYTFPSSFFNNKIKGLSVAVTGRNLLMLYHAAPFDPEATANTGTYYQGIDYFMQPSLRSIGFNVKVQF